MSKNFQSMNSFTKEDLIACGRGELFGEGNPQLPSGNMLMFDRITSITKDGGEFDGGYVQAELDIDPNIWFFDCHFINDPVMPGCLGLDAMWQLLGFFLGWQGGEGRGRALGMDNVKFNGQILPDTKLVTYEIHLKRIINRKIVMGIADGITKADGEIVYRAADMKVGLFHL